MLHDEIKKALDDWVLIHVNEVIRVVQQRNPGKWSNDEIFVSFTILGKNGHIKKAHNGVYLWVEEEVQNERAS